MWSEEQSLLFIELYESKGELWNPKHHRYQCKVRKNEAWIDIAAAMNIDKELCKKKMVSLLASYRREKAKFRKGINSGQPYRSIWFAYKAMSFLDQRRQMVGDAVLTVPKEEGNISEDDTGWEQEASDTASPSMSPQPPPTPPPGPLILSDSTVRIMNKRRKTNSGIPNTPLVSEIQSAQISPVILEDQLSAFSAYVNSKMRSYTPVIQRRVQKQIFQILFEADEALEELPSRASPSSSQYNELELT